MLYLGLLRPGIYTAAETGTQIYQRCAALEMLGDVVAKEVAQNAIFQ